jgi:hypothetical protein
MHYEINKKLRIGAKVVFIKDIPQNDTKSGDKGVVEFNNIFEFTYGIKHQEGHCVPVYSSEIDLISDEEAE